MSERKVLSKYYPPDFDPSAIARTRKPKDAGPKLQTVRLMAPFAMKCTTCGEFIYKGRKFNARKETTDLKYYQIPIYRFYIRCTRCSSEITFKTDPKNMDYECERGAKRNFEPWREAKLAQETEEETLDRLEREEAEFDAMKELETKALDAKTEMEIADSLDQIRTRNARVERGAGAEVAAVSEERDLEQERLQREDEEAAKRAFQAGTGEKVRRLREEDLEIEGVGSGKVAAVEDSLGNADSAVPAETLTPSFARTKKKKKDFGAALGIKRKA